MKLDLLALDSMKVCLSNALSHAADDATSLTWPCRLLKELDELFPRWHENFIRKTASLDLQKSSGGKWELPEDYLTPPLLVHGSAASIPQIAERVLRNATFNRQDHHRQNQRWFDSASFVSSDYKDAGKFEGYLRPMNPRLERDVNTLLRRSSFWHHDREKLIELIDRVALKLRQQQQQRPVCVSKCQFEQALRLPPPMPLTSSTLDYFTSGDSGTGDTDACKVYSERIVYSYVYLLDILREQCRLLIGGRKDGYQTLLSQ